MYLKDVFKNIIEMWYTKLETWIDIENFNIFKLNVFFGRGLWHICNSIILTYVSFFSSTFNICKNYDAVMNASTILITERCLLVHLCMMTWENITFKG